MDTELDILGTVTTVPLTPAATRVMTFWEEVLRAEAERPMMDAKPSGDPIWAVALVLIGSLLSVGAGSFLITIGLGR
jgi:hypothetical protein